MTSPPSHTIPMHVIRAQRFVARHANEALDLVRIAAAAKVSRFHLHREFTTHLGLTPGRYLRLLRLERAASQLAFRGDSVLDIALSSGFASGDAFARAFRRELGCSPRRFRKAPDWVAADVLSAPLARVRRGDVVERDPEVTVMRVRRTRLLVMSHVGEPHRLGETLRRFIAWRREAGLHPSRWDTYNLLYGAPGAAESFRLDVATVAPDGMRVTHPAMHEHVIPAARCAVTRVRGDDQALRAALGQLVDRWLAGSGETPLAHPPMLRRLRWFPDVPATEAETEIRVLLAD